MKRMAFSLIFLLTFAIRIWSQAPVSPWPMFGHDPRHTGRSPLQGAQEGIVEWKVRFEVSKEAASSPVIGADGIVYLGSESGLAAVTPDGKQKWLFSDDASGAYGTPAIAPDGTLYVTSWCDYGCDRQLHALTPEGKLKWKSSQLAFSDPTLGSDGTIYFTSYFHKYLIALNPDGSLKWKFQMGDTSTSTPAIANDGTVFVGSSDSNLYAIRPTGTLKWKFQTGDAVDSTAAVRANGTVLIGSSDGNLYAISSERKLLWKFHGRPAAVCSGLAADGTVYFGSKDGNLYALDAGGKLKWKFKTGNWIYEHPAIDRDGVVYVGSNDRKLYAINPDGTLKWKHFMGAASATAIGTHRVLYAASEDGLLVALR